MEELNNIKCHRCNIILWRVKPDLVKELGYTHRHPNNGCQDAQKVYNITESDLE